MRETRLVRETRRSTGGGRSCPPAHAMPKELAAKRPPLRSAWSWAIRRSPLRGALMERRLEPARPWWANAWWQAYSHWPLMVLGDSQITPSCKRLTCGVPAYSPPQLPRPWLTARIAPGLRHGRAAPTALASRHAQFLVRAIAQRRAGGLLALAPPHRGLLGNLEFHRLQPCALVGAIAKRLRRGSPTRTPPIGAGFNFEGKRFGITHNRFVRHAAMLSTTTETATAN